MEKINLYLMTYKGYKVLDYMVKNQYKNLINTIVIGRDKNVLQDFSEEIETLCLKHNINYCWRGEEEKKKLSVAYSIAISWRWIIDDKKTKLIVLHDSLLPKYRGFSPLVNALINGEKKVGVTAIFANETYDTGDIILQKTLSVTYPVKIEQMIEKISELYVDITAEIFSSLAQDKELKAIPQEEVDATYSLWRDEDDYKIDWGSDATLIQRKIDAVGFPYKGASTILNGQLLRIYDVGVEKDKKIENRDVGKIIFFEDKFPVVVCGKGLVKIIEIKDEKGKDFLPRISFKSRFK